MTSERQLIDWIRRRAPDAGDDCAILECEPWGTLLVTTDSVIDSVHARWEVEGPELFGYKAVARGLSDIAAMGGEPLWTVVAAGLPADVSEAQARALVHGIERTGCRLVGGDVAYGPTPYATATVLGRAHAKGPVLRSGARAGDWVVVSGSLGGSLESGKHATFEPRVGEARELVERCDVGAMIDISDGLSTDLDHILAASGVGAEIVAAAVPCAGVPLENALHDGEDYEILATVRPGDLPAGFVRIGEILEGKGAWIVGADGRKTRLEPAGYEHGG